jgi:hypothetical protein
MASTEEVQARYLTVQSDLSMVSLSFSKLHGLVLAVIYPDPVPPLN